MDEITVPIDPLVSQVFDRRYRIESLLGLGGMGSVYRAVDMRLDRPVAVKLLRVAEGADETRFASEVRTLARFAHPNLVRLFDAGEMQSRAYLVMELIEGPNLAKRMSAGPISLEEAGRIGQNIAGALAYVHSQGIVHRDVKPANIVLDERGEAHLTDFGIAQLVDTTGMTATGITLGTPAYLAPEQAQGAKVGPPADIYALGLVLFECVTGRRAFEGTASEVATARLLRAPVIPDQVDFRWREIIGQMTARRPSDRIDADQVVKGISDINREGEIPTVVPHEAWTGAATAPMSSLSTDDTRVLAVTGGRGRGADDTLVLDATAIAPALTTRVMPSGSGPSKPSTGRRAAMGLLGLLLVGLLAGLAAAGVFSGSTPPRHNATGTHATSTTGISSTTTSTSTTTTSTSTTTTTVPTAAITTAANDLLGAIGAGVSNGDIAPGDANQLSQQLQPIVSSPANPPTPPEVQAFDQFANLLSQDIASGAITGDSTVNSLNTAVTGLAAALGTSVPTTTTTTVPIGPSGTTGNTGITGNTGAPPGPGHGNGH